MPHVPRAEAASERHLRVPLALLGLVFLAQGVGKALDPAGYMLALSELHVGARAGLFAVPLAGLALSWTFLELAAGVAMLHGARTREASRSVALAGVVVALGLSAAYASLTTGAWLRGLPVRNCTCFGAFLPQAPSPFVLVQEAAMIVALAWLFDALLRAPLRRPARSDPSGAGPDRSGPGRTAYAGAAPGRG